MRKNGFPYRRMTASGRFERGEFLVEEAFFDSKAARLAASGRIDLLGADSRLTVLVAPLTSIERVVGAIPLLGDVFGGTMVALPVSVNGDIRDPQRGAARPARGHRPAARHLRARAQAAGQAGGAARAKP